MRAEVEGAGFGGGGGGQQQSRHAFRRSYRWVQEEAIRRGQHSLRRGGGIRFGKYGYVPLRSHPK